MFKLLIIIIRAANIGISPQNAKGLREKFNQEGTLRGCRLYSRDCLPYLHGRL